MTGLAALLDRPDWHARAACRGVGAALFYPASSDTETAAAALAVCERCPVADECAEVGASEEYGVWGGTRQRERARARRGVRKLRALKRAAS